MVGKKVDQIQRDGHVIHFNVNLIGFWESGKTVLLPVEIQEFSTGNMYSRNLIAHLMYISS